MSITAGPTSTRRRRRQVIAPLTTVYTPEPICEMCTVEGTGSFPPNADGSYTEVCFKFHTTRACRRTDLTQPSCFPHVTDWADIQGTDLFYSPGLFCPEGWQTAMTVTSGQGGGSLTTQIGGEVSSILSGIGLETFLEGETAAVCCPSGLTYNGDAFCAQNVTTGSYAYMSCFNDTTLMDITQKSIGHSFPYTYRQGGVKSTSIIFGIIRITAPMIQLNYRSQDINPPTPSATAPSSATADLTTRGGQTGAAGESAKSDSGSSTSLDRGTIGGIAAGASAFLIAMVISFALWHRRRRRAKRNVDGKSQLPDGDGDGYTKPELAATSVNPDHNGHHKPELEAPNRFELNGVSNPRIYELYGNEAFIPHELPTPATQSSRQKKTAIPRKAVGQGTGQKKTASRETNPRGARRKPPERVVARKTGNGGAGRGAPARVPRGDSVEGGWI